MVICTHCIHRNLIKKGYDEFDPYCTNPNSPLWDMWLYEKIARQIGCIHGEEGTYKSNG